MNKAKCPECGSDKLKTHLELGESHCGNCGLVIEEGLPHADQHREGTSKTSPGMTPGRIVKTSWLMNAREKNLEKTQNSLSMASSKLQLSDSLSTQVFEFYKEAVFKDLCVGRDNSSILGSCIYIVCSRNAISKSAQEIAESLEIKDTDILRALKLMKKAFNIKLEPIDPIDLLPRYISNLGLSEKTLQIASELLTKAKNSKAYSGKAPQVIAAAIIYIAARQTKEKTSQRLIAAEIGVMEVTIRKRYKELLTSIAKEQNLKGT